LFIFPQMFYCLRHAKRTILSTSSLSRAHCVTTLQVGRNTYFYQVNDFCGSVRRCWTSREFYDSYSLLDSLQKWVSMSFEHCVVVIFVYTSCPRSFSSCSECVSSSRISRIESRLFAATYNNRRIELMLLSRPTCIRTLEQRSKSDRSW
jgi:hypothetical protein